MKNDNKLKTLFVVFSLVGVLFYTNLAYAYEERQDVFLSIDPKPEERGKSFEYEIMDFSGEVNTEFNLSIKYYGFFLASILLSRIRFLNFNDASSNLDDDFVFFILDNEVTPLFHENLSASTESGWVKGNYTLKFGIGLVTVLLKCGGNSLWAYGWHIGKKFIMLNAFSYPEELY